MKLGSINDPNKDFELEIRRIKDQGFDFVDFALEPPLKSLNIKSIVLLLDELNLEIIGHSNPTLPAIYPLESIRMACLNEIKRSVDIFNNLGAKKITIHPFYHSQEKNWNKIIDSNITFISQICEYTNDRKIELMLENFIYPFDQPITFQKILEAVPLLKVHLDIGHLNILNNPVVLADSFFEKFGKQIIHIHIHDNKGLYDEHLPLGCGDINWIEIIKIIKNYKYNKTITLEIFSNDQKYLEYSEGKLKELLV